MSENIYYFITNECIGCNKCTEVCEQNAIQCGRPYRILADDCNACGKCYEVCTSGAIIPEDDPYHRINREWDSFFGGGVWMIGRNWWDRN